MNKLSLILISLSFAIATPSFAADVNYKCVASVLESTNSSIYYNLSNTEIDTMLTITEFVGHLDAVNAVKKCDKQLVITNTPYQCIAETLQATNSSIYYNLSESDIDAMLTITEFAGHLDAVNAEIRCNSNK